MTFQDTKKAARTKAAKGWTAPTGPFPGVMDYEREYIVGTVIREACELGEGMRFYLKCSVGELAQRVVLALQKVNP